MTVLHEFKREERLPSYFVNRIQDFLSAAHTDLRVTLKSPTEIEVVPVEPYGIAAIDLEGRWRFRTTAVSRAHPGGASGTYIVWAVGTDQDVTESPKPFTDETNYDFDLRITSGADPSGAGVEVFEKIAELDWSGAAITALRQLHNAVTGPMIADGALAAGTDVEWKREANGSWVPSVKPKAITGGKIADALKPSAGASAGTEALRALGTTGSTAAAGNDARLSNERVPSANSVTEAKIADAAVTSRKMKPTILGPAYASGGIGLGAEYASIPGAVFEVTPSVDGNILVWANAVAFNPSDTSAGHLQITIQVNGVDIATGSPNVYIPPVLGAGVEASQTFAFECTGGLKTTVQLRALGTAGQIAINVTRISGLLFAR